LQALVKDGEFFYENPPQPVKATAKKFSRKGTAQKASESEQQLQFLIRAERDRTIHEDEERRLMKQRQKNLELQQRSGQYQSVVRKEKVNRSIKRKENTYADASEPSFAEVMREMQIFDKLTKNPVKTADLY